MISDNNLEEEMNDVPTITWLGQSGKHYRYWICPLGSYLGYEPGNYIFAKETTPGHWVPCYIGQTENLSTGVGDREAFARRNGATHIHAHLKPGGEAVRRAEVTDLNVNWKPHSNEQLV